MIHRSLFPAWLIIFLAAISNSAIGQSSTEPTPRIDSIINPSSLQQLVGVLASDSLQGRFTGTIYAGKAAEFIAEEFKRAGAAPLDVNEGYFMPFAGWTKSQVGFNVMAALKGRSKPNEVIVFCAHYDHVGTRSTNPFKNFVPNSMSRPGDTIFNGANDNASGTSAIINLARYFGQLKNNERTILFIAFSGEELGLLGSKELANIVHADEIKAVINIEMIGRPMSKKRNNAYITGSYLSNLQKLLNKKLLETNPLLYGKKFFTNDTYSKENLFSRSDNYWFAQLGIPSHTVIASSPYDEYYHSPADEVSTLDFNLMTRLVKAIAIGCEGLIEGIQTPSRIDPRSIQ